MFSQRYLKQMTSNTLKDFIQFVPRVDVNFVPQTDM